VEPPRQSPEQPPASASTFENVLKNNPHFADFVKYMGLKVTGTKFVGIEEKENGHATDDSLNAENASADEEDSGESREPEL